MKTKVKIVKGSKQIISEACSVLSVQSDRKLKFDFNTITKELKIFDYDRKSLQEQMYGKSYRIVYNEEPSITRDENIKKILE